VLICHENYYPYHLVTKISFKKMKDRRVKQVLSRGGCRGRRTDMAMYVISESPTVELAEIVLRRGEGDEGERWRT
jgi:hypothetical protein